MAKYSGDATGISVATASIVADSALLPVFARLGSGTGVTYRIIRLDECRERVSAEPDAKCFCFLDAGTKSGGAGREDLRVHLVVTPAREWLHMIEGHQSGALVQESSVSSVCFIEIRDEIGASLLR